MLRHTKAGDIGASRAGSGVVVAGLRRDAKIGA
jgi:hypothetical protein